MLSRSPYSTLRRALSMMKERQVKSLVVERQHAHDAYGTLRYREHLQTVAAEAKASPKAT